jgi:hypothetical protein
MIELLSSEQGSLSPSIHGYRELVRLSRALLHRGSLRPAAAGSRSGLSLTWRATLNAPERSVMADIVRSMPLAAFSGAPEPRASWRTARSFVDAVLDTLVRQAGIDSKYLADSLAGALERGLADPIGLPPAAAASVRVRHSLEQWERQVHDREVPRVRLILQLDPPPEASGTFALTFLAEALAHGGEVFGPIRAAEIWASQPGAHRLADDLVPVQKALREALQRAGRIVAPVEASLASDAPTAARLSGSEAWDLLHKHRPSLEAAGIRVAVAPSLEGLADRFPRPQVELMRGDGAPPESPTLSKQYRVRWQVTSESASLTPEELRTAGRSAPLARLRDVWLPMTAEAAERLARIVERREVDWTGPQALAAALAGEVRLAGDLSDARVVPEPGLSKLLADLQADVVEIPSPPGLKASLRHYQSRGLAWLFHRTRLGLGALLADDMGLGKTVQLIALLLQLRATPDPTDPSGAPTLIICPASVVGNWERELARFAPDLRVVRHHGGARHRDSRELADEAGPHDIVLTTYSLARRDAALLAGVAWGTVVCDEAQNIKNPGAAQARAIRALPARRRIALSGTPVENRLTELWGSLEFLNPGLLGPLERFRREIATPIERDRDARSMRWLRAATAPFILRRMKSDPTIAPELPEKEIIRVYCSLTEEQARLYKAAVDERLNSIDDTSGIERSGRVLQLITALKQICNHPSHYLGDSDGLSGRSGKLERAAEMLEEILESGESALIFTQYVEMGNRICAYLHERLQMEVPFFHGGLSLPARDAMVQRFQRSEDRPSLLVLSLKAGGVGLNLTRATHVLHFDRWWNPAVEDQANDRAHRIGQTHRVQVHHLITLGTLEERIDRMLEDKRALTEAVISGGESWLTRLSTDELRALVSLGSDAAVESIEAWEPREATNGGS